ncbi:hypothetical protein F5141DRAFT_1139752 [Pisolithus sp. B1]|nr:hypothetical protein F5141DRAFT_1139752 [Pisolithus sp. B1]
MVSTLALIMTVIWITVKNHSCDWYVYCSLNPFGLGKRQVVAEAPVDNLQTGMLRERIDYSPTGRYSPLIL